MKIKGILSEPFLVNTGVPQGSHLGPLLFIIFINDVSHGLKFVKILIFADDIKIFSLVNNSYDQMCLQKDLDRIYQWSLLNKLNLNCNKCKIMSFYRNQVREFSFDYSLNGEVLELVNPIKDLGIVYEYNFEFNMHFDSITSKAFRLLGFVKRATKDFKNINSIVCLYKTLVRSNLLYNSQIWSSSYDIYIKKLESVQHKFLRCQLKLVHQ